MTAQKKENFIFSVCDKTRFVGFCIMVFFLPVSSSFIEVAFGLIILSYIMQRTFYFSLHLGFIAQSQHGRWQNLKSSFLESYSPVTTVLNKPIGYYMLIAILSIFVCYKPELTLKGFIFQLAQAIFTYFLFVETVRTKKRLQIILWLLLGSVFMVSADGIFQYFARIEYIRHHPINDGRVTSTFGHANNVAAYLIVLLPILFSLSAVNVWLNKREQPSEVGTWGRISSPFMQWVCLGIFLLGAMCLGLTYSRGPILIFCVSLLFFVIHKPKYLVVMMFVAMLFGAIFFNKMYHERTTNIFDPAEGKLGLSKRFVYWEEALMMIKDNPVLGVGLNNYSMMGRLYKISWGGYPHNGYLQIAAEIGIFGLLAFLWILLTYFKAMKKSAKAMTDFFAKRLLLGLVIGISGFLLYGFFDTNLHDDRLETLMWLVFGISISLNHLMGASSKNLSERI